MIADNAVWVSNRVAAIRSVQAQVPRPSSLKSQYASQIGGPSTNKGRV